MTKERTLAQLRDGIDGLDKQILDLLNQRLQFAIEVGKLKRAEGSAVFRPERESQVIAILCALNKGPINDANIASIWREVMSAGRAMQAPQKIAFLGPNGTFSEEAALKFFGSNGEMLPMTDFDAIFHATSRGLANFGVVPVENSSEGVVTRTLDLLLSYPLHIIGEVILLVSHHLLSKETLLKDIEVVAAHPQALAQCQKWLKEHLPTAELRAVSSNAEGARLAAENFHWAAIGSERSSGLFGLNIVTRAIQDNTQNKTRFAIVCLSSTVQSTSPSGRDCTSLVVSVPNKAGAVHDLLTPLKKYNVSMTRFESRPAKLGQWEYFFYIDLLGHSTDKNIASALSELEEICTFYKLLGSYPQAN